jgi:hypothetical protein
MKWLNQPHGPNPCHSPLGIAGRNSGTKPITAHQQRPWPSGTRRVGCGLGAPDATGAGGGITGNVLARHAEADGGVNSTCCFPAREGDGGGRETVLTGAAVRLTAMRLNRRRQRLPCSQLGRGRHQWRRLRVRHQRQLSRRGTGALLRRRGRVGGSAAPGEKKRRGERRCLFAIESESGEGTGGQIAFKAVACGREAVTVTRRAPSAQPARQVGETRR